MANGMCKNACSKYGNTGRAPDLNTSPVLEHHSMVTGYVFEPSLATYFNCPNGRVEGHLSPAITYRWARQGPTLSLEKDRKRAMDVHHLLEALLDSYQGARVEMQRNAAQRQLSARER